VEETHQPGSSGAHEQGYHSLMEVVADYVVCTLSLDGTITSWNEKAGDFGDYAAEEVVGQNFSRFYTEEDLRRGVPQRSLAVAATEGRYDGEGWSVRKNGTTFWANIVIDAMKNSTGEVTGFVQVTRDLTRQKQAEDALRQQEREFRLLVQGVTDYAIYMLDPGGHIITWNPGAQRIKGYNVQEILGKHFSLFYTEEDRAAGEPQRALDSARRDGRFEKESTRVRKDGSHFWANVVLDAIRAEDGTLLGYAKVTRDITEKKQAETQLLEAREALFQSQKLEAIGQLTGGVAHDFNNLLAVILSGLELLRRRIRDDAKGLRLLENAVAAAKRGASLTSRMLAFARRQALEPEAVDVADLVISMSDLIKRALGSAIVIETRFPLGLSKVTADTNQLELAVLNLCTNARDAMGYGGTITISAREIDPAEAARNGLAPGKYIGLSVSDTGGGMDAATLARAAEPFFTTKGIGKGTGLGLSMVHGLMEQSGGRMALRSEKGKGTTATLFFPVAQQTESMEDTELTIEEQGQSYQAQQQLQVLIVDDDPLILANIGAMLEDIGHQPIEAASGKEAIRILEERREIDLVVTDQTMPEMTGLELVRAIHEMDVNIPVILATGYTDLAGVQPPDLQLLRKPFLQQDLAAAISTALRNDYS